MTACISLGGKLYEPKDSNVFTSINNLAIQFGFVVSAPGATPIISIWYYIGLYFSGSTFVYQSDNSPIGTFAPWCSSFTGITMCPTCVVVVGPFTVGATNPCWVGVTVLATASYYVCEYEYEGKYLVFTSNAQ